MYTDGPVSAMVCYLLLTLPFFAALVSRQYVDMSRIRIEGLLAAFPKLIGSGRQHTYVETENVRYVYQPLEVHVQQYSFPLISAIFTSSYSAIACSCCTCWW